MTASTAGTSTPIQNRVLDEKLLYGSRYESFIRELITNSGVFWLFDFLKKSATDGLVAYGQSLPHWIMLLASIFQAGVITSSSKRKRWIMNFIAPSLYTAFDIVLEGISEFWSKPYHLFYWIWAILMAFCYAIQPRHRNSATAGMSLLLVILLPASYMFSEWTIASPSLYAYWVLDSAHLFILLASLLLGAILGISFIMRIRFGSMLYRLAGHFEQMASWSFDPLLISHSYESDQALHLQRIERTILFMDVRGFTPWCELHTPEQVVEMLNIFYHTAEGVISEHKGFKIQMSGDEIMTRFASIEDGMKAALVLQKKIAEILRPFGLSAGIGIHTGSVIEGLVGSDQTRQFGIFGDAVNTAARLQSRALAHEIVVSLNTWEKLREKPIPRISRSDKISLKGKTEPLEVYILE